MLAVFFYGSLHICWLDIIVTVGRVLLSSPLHSCRNRKLHIGKLKSLDLNIGDFSPFHRNPTVLDFIFPIVLLLAAFQSCSWSLGQYFSQSQCLVSFLSIPFRQQHYHAGPHGSWVLQLSRTVSDFSSLVLHILLSDTVRVSPCIIGLYTILAFRG